MQDLVQQQFAQSGNNMLSYIAHGNRLDVTSHGFDGIDADDKKRKEHQHILIFVDQYLINEDTHRLCQGCRRSDGQENTDDDKKKLKFIVFVVGLVASECSFQKIPWIAFSEAAASVF